MEIGLNIQKKFEEYSDLDKTSFALYYYQLLWKIRPTICFYQIKEQDTINKQEINNFNALLKQKILIERSISYYGFINLIVAEGTMTDFT